MIKKTFIFSLVIGLFHSLGFSQSSIAEAIEKYNSNSVDYISVEELIKLKNKTADLKLIDARAPSEYSISHIQNAIFSGYEDFSLKRIEDKIQKNDTIIVYCSIGVRSEQIGEQLQKAGYKNIFNLYGGIFEWVNKSHKVYNQNEEPTDKIHAYDMFWGQFLEKGLKVY